MPSNIIYVGVPGFTAFTLVNLGQSALTVLADNDFLSGLSQGTPPDGALVGQIAVVFAMIFSLMLVGMACKSIRNLMNPRCQGRDCELCLWVCRLGIAYLRRMGFHVVCQRAFQAAHTAMGLRESERTPC